MQREIKFRTWYKPESKFYFGKDACAFPEFTYSWRDGNRNNYIIQQYTGLKDKNGVEIYEGDIIRCKSFDGWFDKIGYYYNMEVKYQTLESGDSQLSGFLYINIDREVVGNIFENPELLKA